MQTQPGSGSTSPFSIEKVNLQLQRILAHVKFRSSQTLSNFLEFVISETFEGRARQLKEYNIALNVLNRPPDFKPNEDAIVRIHAGRLRRLLHDYYATEGLNDPIIINIPKGSYVPEFTAAGLVQPIVSLSATPFRKNAQPVVAVFPLKSLYEAEELNDLSRLLSERISGELSQFRDISVIGYYSKEVMILISENILDAARSLGADYIITGSLQYYSQSILTRISLLNSANGEVVMTQTFQKKIPPSGIRVMQDEIMHSVIGEVCGHFRVILQKTEKTFSLPDSLNPGIGNVNIA